MTRVRTAKRCRGFEPVQAQPGQRIEAGSQLEAVAGNEPVERSGVAAAVAPGFPVARRCRGGRRTNTAGALEGDRPFAADLASCIGLDRPGIVVLGPRIRSGLWNTGLGVGVSAAAAAVAQAILGLRDPGRSVHQQQKSPTGCRGDGCVAGCCSVSGQSPGCSSETWDGPVRRDDERGDVGWWGLRVDGRLPIPPVLLCAFWAECSVLVR